jgi:hypothetical protein
MQFLRTIPRGRLAGMACMDFWQKQEAANSLVMMQSGACGFQHNVSSGSSSASEGMDVVEAGLEGGEALNLVPNPSDEVLLEEQLASSSRSAIDAEVGDALGIEVEVCGESVSPSFGRIDRCRFCPGVSPEGIYTTAPSNSPDQSSSTTSSSAMCSTHTSPVSLFCERQFSSRPSRSL